MQRRKWKCSTKEDCQRIIWQYKSTMQDNEGIISLAKEQSECIQNYKMVRVETNIKTDLWQAIAGHSNLC